MRKTFSNLLTKFAEEDRKVILLTGDLGYGVWDDFAQKIPTQFINCGVAEQSMMSLAGGMASQDFNVFIYSIANFPTFRCLEQIRNDLSYMQNPATIVSVGSGFSYGSQGYTHHGIEDITIMRSLEGINIFSPADSAELTEVFKIISKNKALNYLRLGKGGEPVIHETPPQNIHYPILVNNNEDKIDGILCWTGTIANEAVKALKILKDKGLLFQGYSCPFIDKKSFQNLLQKSNELPIFTLEEHVLSGGFGSCFLESAAEINYKGRIKNIALNPAQITKIGSQTYLRKVHGIDGSGIASTILEQMAI